MYKNLQAELLRAGISNKEMAQMIGKTEGSFSLKIHGKAFWRLSEMTTVQNEINKKLGSDYTLDYLFMEA